MTGTKASKACATIIARAIRSSRKFGASEHTSVMAAFAALRKSHPEYGDEIDERTVQIGNRSAFSKDLAKGGFVSEGEPSAFVKEVGECIDEVAEAEAKAMDEMTKK